MPDLNFVSSYGSTFKEVVQNMIKSSVLYCEDLKTLPKSSSLEELTSHDDIELEKNAMPQLINIKVEKLKRLNIMMRSDIVDVLPERLVEFFNGKRFF